jgi:hypothetical protein
MKVMMAMATMVQLARWTMPELACRHGYKTDFSPSMAPRIGDLGCLPLDNIFRLEEVLEAILKWWALFLLTNVRLGCKFFDDTSVQKKSGW